MKEKNRKIYDNLNEGHKFLLTDYTDNYELYVKNQKILNERKFGGGCNDGHDIFQKIKHAFQTFEQKRQRSLCAPRTQQEEIQNEYLGGMRYTLHQATEMGHVN